jgi:hypothetical protein
MRACFAKFYQSCPAERAQVAEVGAGGFKKLAVIFGRPLSFERLDNSSCDGRKPGRAFRQGSCQPDGKSLPSSALPFHFRDRHPFLGQRSLKRAGESLFEDLNGSPGTPVEVYQQSGVLASPALLQQAGLEFLHLSPSLIRQVDKPSAPSLVSQRQHGTEDLPG